jgi:hypothetical protein
MATVLSFVAWAVVVVRAGVARRAVWSVSGVHASTLALAGLSSPPRSSLPRTNAPSLPIAMGHWPTPEASAPGPICVLSGAGPGTWTATLAGSVL